MPGMKDAVTSWLAISYFGVAFTLVLHIVILVLARPSQATTLNGGCQSANQLSEASDGGVESNMIIL